VDASPITLGGMTLLPMHDHTKITTAQYVDFQTLAKDFPATIPELLSCFLIPEGKEYNEGYDIQEVHAAVRTLPLPMALGYTAFFFDAFAKSMAASLTSLGRIRSRKKRKALAKEMRMRAEAALECIGAGLPA
jgi:hypothetical protein